MNEFLKIDEIIIIYCEAFINFFDTLKKIINNDIFNDISI
jgi:hypothetical protein